MVQATLEELQREVGARVADVQYDVHAVPRRETSQPEPTNLPEPLKLEFHSFLMVVVVLTGCG